MGRAFEFRKARKMKRWSNMAKTFTRIGREIIIAVKESGPDPSSNSRLRAIIQNAKAANMPKDNIERAIKKASEKSTENFKEVLLEGYAPHGVAILIEAATDNNNRTVANIRSYFNKCLVFDTPNGSEKIFSSLFVVDFKHFKRFQNVEFNRFQSVESHFCCCFYIRIYIIFERHSNSLPRYQDLNVYRLRPVTLDGGVGLKQLRAV